jgi:hypothetical protein
LPLHRQTKHSKHPKLLGQCTHANWWLDALKRDPRNEVNGDKNKQTLKPIAKPTWANLQIRLDLVLFAHGGEKVQKRIKQFQWELKLGGGA